MPTRILIKVNLILIQYRTRKGSATGCKATENLSTRLLMSFQPLTIIIFRGGDAINRFCRDAIIALFPIPYLISVIFRV